MSVVGVDAPTNTTAAALAYHDRGWRVVPVLRGGKAPTLSGWRTLVLTRDDLAREFAAACNIGVVLGTASRGLVDIDLDCSEAVALAPTLLPGTPARFGRASKRESHYLYVAPGGATEKYVALDGRMLVELRADGCQTVFPPSVHPSGERVEWGADDAPAPIDAAKLREAVAHLACACLLARHWPGIGARHEVALAAAGYLLRAGASVETVARIVGGAARVSGDSEWRDRERAARDTAHAAGPTTGGPKLGALIGDAMVDRLSIWLRHDTRAITVTTRSDQTPPPWPTLAPEALHGLAGRVVNTLDPYTEADPVAVLAHVLVAVGNLIGPGAYARVGDDEHPGRLNVALVGETAKGRKGTAWSLPRAVLRLVDVEWAAGRVRSGLSSGEGLIYHVRDAREETQPIKERGRVVSYDRVVVDEGERDKRLLVVEPEMAAVLRRMNGDTNSLSAVLRDAWDHGTLATLTRNAPLRATGAHVSIVAHVTQDELLRELTETERANGFANRFLFLVVRRSKVLPDGGRPPDTELAALADNLRRVAAFGRDAGEVRRDPDALAVWSEVYPRLSEGEPGLVGAILARAEAHVLRLSVLYAVLDCSPLIRPEHLAAALALWDYAEAAARRIFGSRMGWGLADAVLNLLRAGEELTLTQLHSRFARHVRADELRGALALLEERGLVIRGVRTTGGRPASTWRAAESGGVA